MMQQKYGDLKKQLFLFENGYLGFDALFIDCSFIVSTIAFLID
jgi:hypothetical protein